MDSLIINIHLDLDDNQVACDAKIVFFSLMDDLNLDQVACDAKIVITEAIIYASILTIVAFTGERFKPLSTFLPLSSLYNL